MKMSRFAFLILIVSGILTASGQSLPIYPTGLVVSRIDKNINSTWYFCRNGNLQVIEDVHPENSVYNGTWRQSQDTVYFRIEVHYGRRGVGEAWTDGGKKGFNEYVEYVLHPELDSFMVWESTEKNQMKVIKKEYFCPEEFYSPQLPGKYPIASYRLLRDEDLRKYTAVQLNEMLYEISARHGMKFFLLAATEYLKDKSWYFPTHETVDHLLTNIEKRNIKTIEAYIRNVVKN
jgi:hypothetical protein